MSGQKKEICRLCYYETVDTTDVFSEKGVDFDYIGKINKYLYFSVNADDGLPKTVCWMCSQHLDTFHRFYEKINEIQKVHLTASKYERVVLYPEYKTTRNSSLDTSETLVDDDGNTFEILVISEDFEQKSAADNEIEEFELLEVENSDVVTDAVIDDQQEIELIHGDHNTIAPQSRRKRSLQIESVGSTRNVRSSSRLQNRQKGNQSKESSGKKQKPNNTKKNVHEVQEEDDDIAEGDSENEFPTKDWDNDDWPSQETLDEFPKEIIKDGLLQVKGKELMSMICRFYNLDCKLCKKKQRFTRLNELLDHYSSIHEETGFVECCQTKLYRYPAIIMHMARHLQPDAFKCNECGYIVTRPRFLESHMQTHLPLDQKPYACNECPRRFCWKSALRIHLISHKPANERRQYVCHVCGRIYDTPGGLSTHKKLAHSEKKVLKSNVCHICAKNFSTRTGLHEHMLTIHQPREKAQLQCQLCGKWLMNNRCLKTHMVLHSDTEFKCDQCDYVTKKKVLLQRHLLTQHTNERPFVCKLCGRDFKMKRALTVHVAQHGSTTKFQCPFCDRKFNSSTNFYTHRKNVHPKELAEMKHREEEERRRKRIAAGVEESAELSSEDVQSER